MNRVAYHRSIRSLLQATHVLLSLTGCDGCRQQDWFFAGYSTDESTRARPAEDAASVVQVKEDDLAGRNVEVKWEGNDQWYRGQVCAQDPDRQGRRLVQCVVPP